ncbi:MAG: hypothetical protein R3179_09315, partial [Sedimenticolaceae bacterium]|nr:hypothetical protein [Sedimenticolaceae bacterium]
MILRRLAWLLCCLAALPAAADGLLVRSSINPEQAWIGQRVILQIEILAPEAWAKIARFDNIELAGAYVLPLKGEGIRIQETVDGISYSGQRYELSIYPQRSGTFEVQMPPLQAEVRAFGANAETRRETVSLPPVSFMSRVPPGAEGIRGLVSTTRLKASQNWEPDISELKVGDAISRTVRLEAAGISGMAFEPLQQEAIDGLASYPAQASVNDRQVRGTIEGMRTESITYVAERAGTYELPAIRINWWTIGTETLEQIELEGMRLSVKAAPHGKLSGLSSKGARGWITVAAVILVLLLLFMFRHQLLELWRRMADARAESESRYFRALQSSVRRGNTLPIFRDLMRWIDRIDTDNQPATLE